MLTNTISSPPDNSKKLPNTPDAFFDKGNFNASIDKYGYAVRIEKAVKCPCTVKGSGSALPACKNCGGTGWVFINPTETKMILSAMGYNQKYYNWSEVNIGTVRISSSDKDELAYMDRITLLSAEETFSELVYPVIYEDQLFAYTSYDILDIHEIFLFEDIEKPLVRLESDNYEVIGPNKLSFKNHFDNINQCTFSIRYKHPPTYHVIDITRNVMQSPVKAEKGIINADFPQNALGKKAQYILNRQVGVNIFDNSYSDKC